MPQQAEKKQEPKKKYQKKQGKGAKPQTETEEIEVKKEDLSV